MASRCSIVQDVELQPILYINKNEFVGKTVRAMALMKNETAMLLTSDGKPIRILTSLAITRRLIYRGDGASGTVEVKSMTGDFAVVRSTTRLATCLEIMVERRVTSLPVVDDSGRVRGMIGILPCLEHTMGAALKDSLKHARPFLFPVWWGLASKLKRLTLGDIISEHALSFVDMKGSAISAAKAISKGKGKPVLVLSRVGRIVGIVTPMDINSNIVRKGLDPNATLVSTIMTPKPDMVSPDTTVLQALRKMTEENCQYLPVLGMEQCASKAGVVTVIDILHAMTGRKGEESWKALFNEATGGGMHRSHPARLVDQNRPISSLGLLQPVVVADNEFDNPDDVENSNLATRCASCFPRR